MIYINHTVIIKGIVGSASIGRIHLWLRPGFSTVLARDKGRRVPRLTAVFMRTVVAQTESNDRSVIASNGFFHGDHRYTVKKFVH